MIRKHKRKLFWAILFIFIFLLSQSHLVFNFSGELGFMGFPNWLWVLIGVHAVFIIALYFFMQQAQND